jgi:carbamate kinase
VPVIERDGAIVGVEAVIDKDFAAAELARVLHADTLLILTAVDSIEINYNTPQAKSLTQVTPEELLGYADAGHFAPGSMLPKVQAAAAFAQHNPGKQAIVTSLEKAEAALAGQAGTRIVAS